MKSSLRILVYLYIYSIVFDGIFRKWLLPQYSSPIMAIKQVLAVLIFIYGCRYWKYFTKWEIGSLLIGFITFLTTLAFGHGNIYVALYGCLPFFFGIPLCLIISKILYKDDLIRIGKVFVFVLFVNSILIIAQYNLPITHILNYTAGDVERIEDYAISELAGGFRPMGIFYHNTHNSLFSLVALSFLLYFYFFRKGIVTKLFLIVVLVLDVVACVCSVSRTNIFLHIGLIAFFFLVISNFKTKRNFVLSIFIFLPIFYFFVQKTTFFTGAIENLENRFENASEAQYADESTLQGTLNDIWYRGIQYHVNAMINPKTFDGSTPPFWGFGQGMSTQIGGRILDVGGENSGFSLAEFDGLRIMCESGLLLGWFIVILRLGYVLRFFLKALHYKKRKQFMSYCLLPAFFVSFFLTTTWGNLFSANMTFVIGGLFLASQKDYN